MRKLRWKNYEPLGSSVDTALFYLLLGGVNLGLSVFTEVWVLTGFAVASILLGTTALVFHVQDGR